MIPGHMTELPSSASFPFDITRSVITDTYPAHRHDFIELSYVAQGTGREIVNGKEYALEPGGLTFLLPFQYHEIFADRGSPLTLLHCGIDMNILTGSAQHGGGLSELLLDVEEEPLPYIRFTGEAGRRIHELFHSMYDEHRQAHPWKHVLLRAKLLETIVLFDRERKAKAQSRVQAAENKSPGRSANIWSIASYIHAHFSEDITLSHLSEKFALSVPYLSKMFKDQIGENFVSFLSSVRIRYACGLLATTKMKITDIAMEVGFGSFSSFSRAFHAKKGLSPHEYRVSIAASAIDGP